MHKDVIQTSDCKYLKYLLGEKYNSISEFTYPSMFKDCSGPCEEYHTLFFVTWVYYTGMDGDKDKILHYTQDENKKVRELAVKYLLEKYGVDCLNESIFNDPDYKIMALFTKYLPDDISIKYTKDENPEIQIEVLKELKSRDLENKNLRPLLKQICRLITNVDIRVRALAAEMLGIYKDFDSKILSQLLSRNEEETYIKNVSGAFVYGLEDESSLVRKNTVLSLYQITNYSLAEKAFEYLVDTLNDENKEIREISCRFLRDLSDKYNFRINQEYITQISCSLEEDNENISKNIYYLFSNMIADTFESYEAIVDIFNKRVESDARFYYLLRFILRNFQLAIRNSDKIVKQFCCVDFENKLLGEEYESKLIFLLIAKIFSDDIVIKDINLKRNLGSIYQKVLHFRKVDSSPLNCFLKQTILILIIRIFDSNHKSELKSIFDEFKSVFKFKRTNSRFHNSLCIVFKYLKQYHLEKGLGILRLNFLFKNFKIGIDALSERDEMLNVFRNINPDNLDVLENTARLTKIVRLNDRGCIYIEGVCSSIHKDSTIVLENDSGERLNLKYTEMFKFKIIDSFSCNVKCYLINKLSEMELIISEVSKYTIIGD